MSIIPLSHKVTIHIYTADKTDTKVLNTHLEKKKLTTVTQNIHYLVLNLKSKRVYCHETR